jgi:hypothetical protein
VFLLALELALVLKLLEPAQAAVARAPPVLPRRPAGSVLLHLTWPRARALFLELGLRPVEAAVAQALLVSPPRPAYSHSVLPHLTQPRALVFLLALERPLVLKLLEPARASAMKEPPI